MPTRLGIIAVLTGLFSTSMSMLTMASLQEIFSALEQICGRPGVLPGKHTESVVR
ncbi:hypothetical protein F4678DRAFT_448404 [Xylaria arbuscula]|nr:hypothetical protein F4678DRAFT_448404 [Xylaria arbuscula]